MVINIYQVAKKIKIDTTDLITRPVGRLFYKKTLEKLKDVVENEVIVLDFENIVVIDSSFIDEFLVKLLQYYKEKESPVYLKLKNISTIAEINIDLVFKSYSSYNNDNLAVVTDDICQNNSFFIGPLSEIEKDIIEFLRVNKTAAIDDIIRFTGISENEIKNKLDELYDLRVVRKESENMYLSV